MRHLTSSNVNSQAHITSRGNEMNSTTISALEQEIAQLAATIEALQIQKIKLEAKLEMERHVVTKECDIPQELLDPTPSEAKPAKKAARVKKAKQVEAKPEPSKGKRDVNAGDKQRIDDAKATAMSVKPEPVQQSKGVTKKTAEKAKNPTKHDGMSYKELRNNISTRKAALNKADQERLSKHAKNTTWDGAIACYEWLNKYFPTNK